MLEKNKPAIKKEVLRLRRGQNGAPWKVLEFSFGEGVAADGDLNTYEDVRLAERSPQKLDSPDILAIKGLGQFKEFIAISRLRKLIEDWYVSDFHIEDARATKDAGYSERVSTKMFTYLVMLRDPEKQALLCVEEPENQLYPQLLYELAEEFRIYSEEGGQVFISTHSPDFLNAVHLEELYCLVKENGYTQIYKASENKLIKSLYEAGDLPDFLRYPQSAYV